VLDYLGVLAVAAVGTFLLTFPARWLALRIGAVVPPDERRVHERPTPTIGGTAMFVAFLAAMAVAGQLPYFRPMFQGSSEPLGVVLAAAVIFAVGFVDDLREVSAPAKVAGQVLAASVLYFLGVTMFSFKIPFAGVVVLSPDVTPLLTALWVVGMANAINLIDGLDGLAAGIVAIAGGAFTLYSVHLVGLGVLGRDNLGPLVAVIACGVCLGFLPHNFHPARVFMGDAGALFLGLLMAASTSVVGGRTADVSGETYFFFAPLFIPFVILGVPILDTAFAIVRRTAKRSVAYAADLDHLHHRLVRLGHGHRRSVLILWGWTAILSGFVLYPTFTDRGNAVLPFAALGLAAALYTLFHPGVRHRPEAAGAAGAAGAQGGAPGRSPGRAQPPRRAARAVREPGRPVRRTAPGPVAPEAAKGSRVTGTASGPAVGTASGPSSTGGAESPRPAARAVRRS
jgi:UDP-GlcNAc:undecaprenyl-phosphate GlcNAc-1-phosphate transferase